MSNKITKTPQIRFAGFTDAWEKQKLSELLFPADERNNSGKYKQDDILAASLGTELVKKHIFFGLRSTEESVKNYRVVNSGDVIYTKSPIKGYPNGIIRTNKGLDGIVPSLYCVYHSIPSINPNIIQSYFEDKGRLNAYLFPLVNVGARNNVNITDSGFLEGTICIPQDINEQSKIVDFINHLTNIITHHQRKLELLKDMKKSLLQKMLPKDGANVPEIRFAGYTDAWEPRRLGEYANFRRGSFPQPYGNKEWYDGDGAMPFVQVIDVTEHLVLVDDTKQKISKLAQPKSVFVPKGKVLVTLQGSIGRVAITQYDCFVDRTLLIFEGYEKPTDENFWAYIIQKKFEIERNKAPGGTIKTITKEALSSFEVLLPKYKEQKQIGTFFNQLDNLITLHQRELNSLKNMKKSLLQQMFI